MLDKTLPYFNVIMKRRTGLPIAMLGLPSGFSIAGFVTGDEVQWASIETAVGEFMTEGEALTYFQTTYLPYNDDLARRCVFVRDADGGAVGTITSWWNTTKERRDPAVHRLAVRPDVQGLGLGKALVAESLKRSVWLEGDRAIFLHTQTWSYRAIAIYLKAGFEQCNRGYWRGRHDRRHHRRGTVVTAGRRRRRHRAYGRLGGFDYAVEKTVDTLTFAGYTLRKPSVDSGNLVAHPGIYGLLGMDIS